MLCEGVIMGVGQAGKTYILAAHCFLRMIFESVISLNVEIRENPELSFLLLESIVIN